MSSFVSLTSVEMARNLRRKHGSAGNGTRRQDIQRKSLEDVLADSRIAHALIQETLAGCHNSTCLSHTIKSNRDLLLVAAGNTISQYIDRVALIDEIKCSQEDTNVSLNPNENNFLFGR